ncbi:hypothetical protein ACFL67_03055 [candidate division KSB1 bacterium]
MSTEKKRSWISLVITSLMLIASIFIIVNNQELIINANSKILYMIGGVILIGGLAQLSNIYLTQKTQENIEVIKDERDNMVGNQAMYGQCWALIIGIVVWCVSLVVWAEINDREIAIMFMLLIIITIPIINLFGRYISMLIYYYKMEKTG